MSEPFVSIIIPVRNEAGHITRCLDSVLALDLGGIGHEILIVDGMSEDGTREIIARFQDARCKMQDAKCVQDIRILDNPSRGVAAGRNIGIKAARGDVLVLLDAHAKYAADYVKRCLEVMEKTGAANVGGPALALPGGAGAMAGAIALAHHSRFGLGGGQFRDPGAEGFVETVWPGCYRRDVFGKTGSIDERRSRTEDLEFNTRLRAAGFTIYLSPQIKAWYYCRTTLGATWRQRWADGYEIAHFLPDNPAAPRLRHLIPLAFVMSLILLSIFTLVCGPGVCKALAAWSLVAVMAVYLCVNLASTISAWFQRTQTLAMMMTDSDEARRMTNASFALLPLVFVALHFSYGLGSAWGLLTQPFRQRRSSDGARPLQNAIE